MGAARPNGGAQEPLYTPEERRRRDASPWTTVQGVLAPVQFAVCLVSVALVLRFLVTGEGYAAATASILAKTFALYAIMVTGSIWEKEVFGRWLFAPAFFWEDAVSMVVIALHTAYLAALWTGALSPAQEMALALAAYATYVVNAAQFLWKLRLARLGGAASAPASLDTLPLAGTVARGARSATERRVGVASPHRETPTPDPSPQGGGESPGSLVHSFPEPAR
jgi:3-vinyl bacteriochlorophyllide hydratase